MQRESGGPDGRWHELAEARYLLPVITLALGVALFAFNIFFVVTALPNAVTDLDGAAYITWPTSLYLIFSIVAGAAAGLAKQRFGGRLVFMVATGVFAVGTILCGAAPTMPFLLAGRVLQGLGAGMVEGLSYALIPVLFPPRLVPKVFGVEAVMWVIAAFGGPAIAGLLTANFGWRMAFLSSLVLAAIFAVLVAIIVPKEDPGQEASFFPGLRLGLIAVGLLMVTVSSTQQVLPALALVVLAVAVLAASVIIDRGARARLFPIAAFSRRLPAGVGFWVVVLMAIPESAIAAYLPYTAQHAWGYSPTWAGALHSILAISWSLSQITLSTFASPTLRRELIWVGSLLLAAGLLISAAGVAVQSISLVIAAQVMCGAAFGVNWGSISQLLMESTPEAERSLASGLLPTAQSAGFALGASLAGLCGNLLGFAGASHPDDLRAVVAIVFAIAGLAAAPVVPLAWKVVRSAGR